jgi:hypothetical protein
VLEVEMRKISVRLSVAFLFLVALPLGCTSSPGSSTSGGSGGSSARTGGAGGGTSSTTGGSGGTSSTGSGGTNATGGGTSDATGGSSGTGGDATGGSTDTGGTGGTSDTTGGSTGAGGDTTEGTGGMSAGGGGETSPPDGGTETTGDNQGDARDTPGSDMAEDSGNDTTAGVDGGEGEAGGGCADNAQNGAETDVDCGGGTCTKCASGLMCKSDDDCRNGSCASGKCADSFAATAPVTQSGNMWRITLGSVIFEVDPAVAGKVATFSIDGVDVVDKNIAATGSVFWTSPQNEWYPTPTQTWPPPTEMDSVAYTPSVSGNVLTMTGPVGTDKLSISKRYWGNVEHQAITLEYTIHNNNSAAVAMAPWEITRVHTGGLTFFPNGEPAVKLGDANFSAVPFTSAQGALWFKYSTAGFATSSLKGGADGLEGWAAHIACGTGLEGSWAYPTCAKSPILIKEWTDIPAAATAPAEKEVEIYAAQNSYEEFEQQSAYQSIPAGGTMVWTMHWLLRYLPSTVAPTAGSATLLTWVRGQLL